MKVTINAETVKDLRAKTGAGMMDCKKALVETDGDVEKAIRILREKGIAKAAQKASRSANEGAVYAYIHPGAKVGTLVLVNCETDFVARTEDFQQLIRDLAMQVTGHFPPPKYVRREDVPAEEIASEKEIYAAQARNEGKPEKILDKIVDGKIESYYKQMVLMEQEFIKDTGKTVKDRIDETIAKVGENIQVARFARFQVGQ
jgi:elongation factor Ts